MANGKEHRSYQFQSFRLDTGERLLLKNGEKIALTPKAFDVLVHLVERNGHLVEKEELLQEIWPDSFVEEGNLTRIVHTLRRALGETNDDRYIETIPKTGYRFIADVSSPQNAETANASLIEESVGQPTSARFSVPTKLFKQRSSFGIVALAVLAGLALLYFRTDFSTTNSAIRQQVHTTNEEAYRFYSLGRALAEKGNAKDAEKAIEYLERATALDPNYALAYVTLAGAYGTYAMSGGGKRENYIKQRNATEKALAIDASLPEAHSSLGEIKMIQDWDFHGAERSFLRARELGLASADGHRDYAVFLNSMGRFDEAIAEIKTALRYEPVSVLNHRLHGMVLFYARRYDEAAIQLERTIELDPNFRGAHGFLCSSYRMNGESDKAFECFLRSPGLKSEDATEIESWKSIYSESGWPGIRRRQIEEARNADGSSKLSAWDLTNLYGELGERDLAFATIEKGMGRGGWGWTVTKVNPALDSLRPDPRFNELLRRIGLD